MRRTARGLGYASIGLLMLACVTDHDALAKRQAGAGGSGGDGGSGGTHVLPPMGGSGGGGGEQVGTPRSVLPDGDSLLTLVHGQVDAERVAFCFSRLGEDGVEEPEGAPAPRGGIAYGQHRSFMEPGGLSLKDDDIVVIALAGDEQALDVASCEDAIADAVEVGVVAPPMGEGGGAGASGDEMDPPPTLDLRFQRLPLISKGSLDRGRNMLLVLAGCMGAPAHSDDDEEELCGSGYRPGRSTLALVVGAASRQTQENRLGLQFLHASLSTKAVDVNSVPALSGAEDARPLAFSVALGQLEPHTIDLNLSSKDYEVGAGGKLEVLELGQRRLQQTVDEIADIGDISPPVDGKAYTTLLLGPGGGRAGGEWWNPSTLTLVANDPE